MNNKTVYSFDLATGKLIGPVELDEGDLSPLESTPDHPVYLIPGNCLEAAPPTPAVGLWPFVVDGVWVLQVLPADPEPEPEPTPEEKRARLKGAVTAKRWLVETGGVTLPSGAKVKTGIEDQNRISNAVSNGLRMGLTSVSFKGADDNFVTMPIADLVVVADTVALHVQACFDAERSHHTAIAALLAADLDAYDVTVGWPA